jgi:glutamate-1-semialdehyde 2,1-aminomutase
MWGHQAVGLLPDDYPQFFSRGHGARLWDADGNELLDFMCAYGPNLFGYGEPSINAAFVRQLEIGDTLTGPTALVVELAEQFTRMVTHADWAIFCKNGTDATSMALVIARAHTQRKSVILAKGAYHGAAPWCTPRPAGTTPEDKAHQVFCAYNDIASLEEAAAKAGDDLAADASCRHVAKQFADTDTGHLLKPKAAKDWLDVAAIDSAIIGQRPRALDLALRLPLSPLTGGEIDLC